MRLHERGTIIEALDGISGPRVIPSNTSIRMTGIRLRLSIAAVALLALGVPAVFCPAFGQSMPVDRFDVLGIKINTTLVDARKLLDSALAPPVTETCDSVAAYKDGPTLRTRCLLHDGRPTVEQTPNTVTQMMTGGGGQGWFHMTEQVELDVAGINGSEKVVSVSRGKKFPKGQEVPLDKVVEGLKQKYGEATSYEVQSQYGVLMKWIYDQQGRLIKDKTPLWRYECDISSKVSGIDILGPGPGAGNGLDPATINDVVQGCGFAVIAEVGAMYNNPQIAGAFKVLMVDQAVLYDALGQRNTYLKAAVKAKQDNDVKNAKGNVKY